MCSEMIHVNMIISIISVIVIISSSSSSSSSIVVIIVMIVCCSIHYNMIVYVCMYIYIYIYIAMYCRTAWYSVLCHMINKQKRKQTSRMNNKKSTR